jgi:hypothetical protein
VLLCNLGGDLYLGLSLPGWTVGTLDEVSDTALLWCWEIAYSLKKLSTYSKSSLAQGTGLVCSPFLAQIGVGGDGCGAILLLAVIA